MSSKISALVVAFLLLFSTNVVPTYSQSRSDAYALTMRFDEEVEKARTLDEVERIASKYGQIGDNYVQYHILTRLGGSASYWGSYARSLDFYSKALSLESNVNEFNRRGAIRGISNAYAKMGLHQKALDYLERYLAQLKVKIASGDEYSQKESAFTLLLIGEIYRDGGQYQKALEYLSEARSAARLMEDGTDYAEVSQHVERYSLWHMAQVYEALGDLNKALGFCEQYVKSMQGGYGEEIYSTVLVYMGHLYARMNNQHKALELAKAGEGEQLADTDVRRLNDLLANLYLDAGRTREAEVLIRNAGNPRSLGRLYLEKSELERAEQQFDKLRQAAENSRNVDDLVVAYTGLGRTNELKKDYRKAQEFYVKALDQTEELRSGLLPPERKSFYEVKMSGFPRSLPAKGLTRVRIKVGELTNVVDSNETTKARAFTDQMALRAQTHSGSIPGVIFDKENELVTHLASLKKELGRTDRNNESGRYDSLIRESRKAESDLKAFVDMLWQKYRPYAAVKYPRPVTLKDSGLRDDECVLYFDVSDDGLGVILIKNKKIAQALYTDLPRAVLEKDVREFIQPFETRDMKKFNPSLAESLYKRLVSTVLADVPRGAPITIIPDGILAVLPFEALVTSGRPTWKKGKWGDYPEGLTFLGDVYPISYYQSITALTLTRDLAEKTKPGRRMLVLADPVFQLKDDRAQATSQTRVAESDKQWFPNIMATIEGTSKGAFKFKRLPETAVLAGNLEKLYDRDCDSFTGLKANKKDFFANTVPKMEQYGSVVFATHGLFSAKIPGLLEPFLALTMVPPGADGFLKMSDVMSLKMNADIVALTACQTGLGKELSGEGVMSMGRAFQYAGARTVLMSLWSVAEKSSVQLVESFFRNLKGGKGKLEALRLAREEIRKAGYDHPFFWAPFILVGETD